MLGGPLGQGLGIVPFVSGSSDFLLAQDSPDTALFEATGTQHGILNATDAFDVGSFLGLSVTTGTLSFTENPDVALFNGSVEWPIVTGKLIAKEASDVAWFVEGRLINKIPSPVPKNPWDCLRNTPSRRRTFWTTQLEACGDIFDCGRICAIPGLIYEESDDGRTILTKDWLQSLILNILNTRARSDLRCPTPAATYGHWSESYRDDGIYVGAKFWNAAERSYTKTADAVRGIGSVLEADLQKLVQMRVAIGVKVETIYEGKNSVLVSITATSAMADSILINLAGTYVSSGWEWR